MTLFLLGWQIQYLRLGKENSLMDRVINHGWGQMEVLLRTGYEQE